MLSVPSGTMLSVLELVLAHPPNKLDLGFRAKGVRVCKNILNLNPKYLAFPSWHEGLPQHPEPKSM